MPENVPEWAQSLIREVTILNERLPTHVDWTERNIKDHELRLRDLEKARWQTAWVTAAASAILTAIIVFVVNTALGG
jgi:type IV secretory pathway component VirB8